MWPSGTATSSRSCSWERDLLIHRIRVALLAFLLLAPLSCATTAGIADMAGGSTGEGSRGRVRSMESQDVLLDTTPARQILSLWKSTPRAGSGDGRSRETASRIAVSPAYRVMRGYLHDRVLCRATDDEVARAIELPDSGICGFGLDPAYHDQDSIAAMLDEIDARGDGLRRRVAERVARYLPAGGPWRKTTVWFVISSQSMFDAVTMDSVFAAPGGGPVVLMNVTDMLPYGETSKERVDALEHVLAHELFHAGMRVIEGTLPGWAPYRRPRGDVAFIAKAMLDEGVAHYIDWLDRPGADSLFTWKPSGKEKYAFERLTVAVRRVRQADATRVERAEITELAVAGPTWTKYGAISGMFAAHRIEAARGREALRQAIADGPAEFLRVYREVAARNPRLGTIPSELIPSQ